MDEKLLESPARTQEPAPQGPRRKWTRLKGKKKWIALVLAIAVAAKYPEADLGGTVSEVSQGEMVSDNGMMLTTVRVKAVNPGLVTSNYTASASIGSYVSYGESPIQISESSVITAEASGKISGLNLLAGDPISAGHRLLHRRQRG